MNQFTFLIASFVLFNLNLIAQKDLDTEQFELVGYNQDTAYFFSNFNNLYFFNENKLILSEKIDTNFKVLTVGDGYIILQNSHNPSTIVFRYKGLSEQFNLTVRPLAVVYDSKTEQFFYSQDNIYEDRGDVFVVNVITKNEKRVGGIKSAYQLLCHKGSLVFFDFTYDYGFPDVNMYRTSTTDLLHFDTLICDIPINYLFISPDNNTVVVAEKTYDSRRTVYYDILRMKNGELKTNIFKNQQAVIFDSKNNKINYFNYKTGEISSEDISELSLNRITKCEIEGK